MSRGRIFFRESRSRMVRRAMLRDVGRCRDHAKAQHLAVERERPLEVRYLQMDTPDAGGLRQRTSAGAASTRVVANGVVDVVVMVVSWSPSR